MPLFPLFADLSGREVLVVGGGDVALRKIEALLHADARVSVHARQLHPQLSAWLAQGRLQRREGEFDPAWIDAAWLLVVATDDGEFNARLAAQAREKRKLANVVDDAHLSSFHVPALIDRAPLQVAISSGGSAPMLARRMRERLEILFDPSLGELAGLFARHREAIRARFPDMALRRRWFDAMIDGPVPSLLREGRADEARHRFEHALHAVDVDASGRISLIGTGNGVSDQLTLGALRAMNQADLIVFDADVGSGILNLARKDAARTPAPQSLDECLDLLAGEAAQGRHVAWLKRGDAFRAAPLERLPATLAARGCTCEAYAGVASISSSGAA